MIIEGKFLKREDNTVYIMQHYTGIVYKAALTNVRVCTDKNRGIKWVRIDDHGKADFVCFYEEWKED